jgi:hypothetical protein
MLSMDEKAIVNNNLTFRQEVLQLLDSLHTHTSQGFHICLQFSNFNLVLNRRDLFNCRQGKLF